MKYGEMGNKDEEVVSIKKVPSIHWDHSQTSKTSSVGLVCVTNDSQNTVSLRYTVYMPK